MWGKLLKLRVKPNKRMDFIHFIKIDVFVAEMREPGTVRFDLYLDPKEEHTVYLYEAYVEKSTFDNQHKENEPFKLWESWIEKEVLDGIPEVLFEGDAICALARSQALQEQNG